MKKKIFTLRLLDLIIWVIIVTVFTYNVFFNKIENKTIWFIIIILMIISLIIKIIYIKKR